MIVSTLTGVGIIAMAFILAFAVGYALISHDDDDDE